MATTYARPTYNQIINSVRQTINEEDSLAGLAPENAKMWILEACQRITHELRVEETRILRLIQGQEDYPFSNTTTPVTGTGTINVTANQVAGVTAAGTGTITQTAVAGTTQGTITGVGTTFISQLVVGNMIIVSGEAHEIVEIDSNTSLIINGTFQVTVSGSAFTYSTTRLARELTVGSVIVTGGQSLIVTGITDGYTAVINPPASPNLAAQTFTVDTKVTEIPPRMKSVYYIDRLESNFRREVLVKDISWLLDLRKKDMIIGTYTNYNTPYAASVYRTNAGVYTLKVYPVPDTNKDMTIYSLLKIKPREFVSDTLATPIQLDESYEEAIRLYVEAKMWGWMHEHEMRDEKMLEFKAAMAEEKKNLAGPVTMRMPYK